MSEYNFGKFKSAYEAAALALAKKQNNEFYDFVFMNYAGDIENQITDGIAAMMAVFDPPIEELE